MDRRDRLQYVKKSTRKQPVKNIGRIHILSRIMALVFLVTFAGIFFQYYQRGDGKIRHPKVLDARTQEQSRQDFDSLMMQIFRNEVMSDSLTLNYMVENLQTYELSEAAPSLGHYSLEEMQADLALSENWIASMESFDYDKLSEEQQLTYDVIYTVLKQSMGSMDLLEYSECLSPTTGIQIQLPMLLVEYHFTDKTSVEKYIQLLKMVPAYFQEILVFEEQKSANGLFMNDRTLDSILSGCESFISQPEQNYLISTFGGRIQALQLTAEEQTALVEANKKAVLEQVIPAYQSLIEGLTKLKGSGKNTNCLCGLENGHQYYEYLVHTKTGSNRSIAEISRLLDKTIEENKKVMAALAAEDKEIYTKAQQVQYPCEKAEETIQYLQEQIQKDFPALPEGIECQVKYVDKSMESVMSPAFYLTPCMDNYQNNTMYLNGSDQYDLSKAFTTIAHESYPGHLYQTCYFMSKDHSPVRNIVNINGYTEGWGTYAELYSYGLAGLEEEIQTLLYTNTLLTLAIYAKADLEVNYNGWSLKQLRSYLSDFGFSKTSGRAIYDTVIAEPVSYMPYTLGYLEIEALRETAEQKLGESYSIQKFHEFFLQIGSVPFVVLQDRLEQWIQEEK
ncbi:MAG: DUF885 domain-containing protein [Lachnospiraceae bacterium]|nr:DUF885 domain-containing protein [Lachnospiraceae bacterium]